MVPVLSKEKARQGDALEPRVTKPGYEPYSLKKKDSCPEQNSPGQSSVSGTKSSYRLTGRYGACPVIGRRGQEML